MNQCWQMEANDRPTFSTIVKEMESFLTLHRGYLTLDDSLQPLGSKFAFFQQTDMDDVDVTSANEKDVDLGTPV